MAYRTVHLYLIESNRNGIPKTNHCECNTSQYCLGALPMRHTPLVMISDF
jgi:hypothetical protein